MTDLVVAFDGSGSTDSDGTVATYAWDFGDTTSTATGRPRTTRTRRPGPTPVTLTVTDNDGDRHGHQDRHHGRSAGRYLAVDNFGRTATGGWGNADTGGAWSRSRATTLFGQRRHREDHPRHGGCGPRTVLPNASQTASDATVQVALDKIPNGGGAFVAIVGRGTSSNAYRGKVKIAANGALTLYVTKVVAGAETTVLTGTSTVTYAVGDTLHLRMQTWARARPT